MPTKARLLYIQGLSQQVKKSRQCFLQCYNLFLSYQCDFLGLQCGTFDNWERVSSWVSLICSLLGFYSASQKCIFGQIWTLKWHILYFLPLICQKYLRWPHKVLLTVKSVQLVHMNCYLALASENGSSFMAKRVPHLDPYLFMAIWYAKMHKCINWNPKQDKLGTIYRPPDTWATFTFCKR